MESDAPHAHHHVGEVILLVSPGTVGIDSHEPDSLGGIFLHSRSCNFIRIYHIGTMVTSEKNHQEVLFEIGQRIGVAICGRQREFRGGIANL
jgi:hypothetical protein